MHSWNDDVNPLRVANMKNAYIQQGQTVIFIDWSYYSTNLVYWLVIDFVPSVGNIIGCLVVNLLNIFGTELSRVECIGHSMGAHGCGFAGKYINQNIGQKIGNIIGLDPSGYEDDPPSYCLNKNDADIVKVIHTNAGAEGIIRTLGKLDFFRNGGIVQPDCLPVDSNCSHYASLTYWTNGMNRNRYVGTECPLNMLFALGVCRRNPTAIMGEGTDASASGVFFLRI